MTPEELTAKLQAGEQLLVQQRAFYRLSYIPELGGPTRPKFLGLISDSELAESLVAIGSVYTTDQVVYSEFQDPAEPTPRVPAFILVTFADAIATVPTIDDELATQLSVLSATDVADLIKTLRPPAVQDGETD